MKSKFIYMFWALVLFLVGIALLPGSVGFKKLSTENWVLIEGCGALAFAITYFLDGIKKWGWLLPAFICAGMAIDLSKELTSLFHTQPNGVPILIGIALWFFVGFLINRMHWWLLIPAYGLIIAAVETAINTMIVPSVLDGGNMSTLLSAYSSGAGIMLMLSLPFFVVYILSKKNWWAFIPAGCLTSLALTLVTQTLFPNSHDSRVGLYGGVLFLGIAITFGILWLRHKTQPTQWALYPTAGMFALAVLAYIFGNGWNTISDQTKAIGFGVASVVFLICYLVSGLRKWGWLFPILICASMPITLWMSINKMDDSPLMGLPILLSIALPFYVGFALDHKRWGLFIPAIILTVVMLLTLINDTHLEDAGVMFIFALPFFIIFALSKKNWWAFIPAGILASFGILSVIEILVPHAEYGGIPNLMSWDVFISVLFLGFAVTFGIPWLRRKTQPTSWTKYPAIGFLALAILSFVLREHFQELWLTSVLLVTAGTLLLASLNNKVPAGRQQTPEVKA